MGALGKFPVTFDHELIISINKLFKISAKYREICYTTSSHEYSRIHIERDDTDVTYMRTEHNEYIKISSVMGCEDRGTD